MSRPARGCVRAVARRTSTARRVGSPSFPQLPPGFRFGTSTAAYQIEGAATEDGRGPSVWDTFTAEPGRVVDGSTGAVACDHYHRVEEDVELMRASASRATASRSPGRGSSPTGTGRSTRRAWRSTTGWSTRCSRPASSRWSPSTTGTCPQALEDDGGWLNRATTDRFQEYAAIVGAAARRPGRALDPRQRAQRRHDARLRQRHPRPGQGAALRGAAGRPPPAARRTARPRSRCARPGATSVGCANNHAPIWPASDNDADVGRDRALRRPVERAVRRADAVRPLPRRPRADLWTSSTQTATWPRSASRSTSTASTTTTRSRSRPPPRTPSCRASSPRGARLPDDRLRLAGRPRRRCASC